MCHFLTFYIETWIIVLSGNGGNKLFVFVFVCIPFPTQTTDCYWSEESFLSLIGFTIEINVKGTESKAQVRPTFSIFKQKEPWTEPQVNPRSSWVYGAVLPWPQSTYFTVRGQSYFSRLPKYWPPIPLSPWRVCPPPATKAGGTHSPGREGDGGVNILEDERNRIALLQ